MRKPWYISCIPAIFFALVSSNSLGQMLLFEDFEDGVADAFTPLDGNWRVTEGVYECRSENDGFDYFSISIGGASDLTDYSAECDVRVLGSVNQVLGFRFQDPANFYDLNVRGEPYHDVVFSKVVNGSNFFSRSWPFVNSIGESHHISIHAVGSQFSFEVDGRFIGQSKDDHDPFLTGGIALIGFTGGIVGWQTAYFDNVAVYATDVVANELSSWSNVKVLFR